MSDPNVFHRHAYAQALTQQLLHPGPLDQGLRSGVFLSGIRRIGKTTFVRQDLIPALLEHGTLTLYIDLWTDRLRPPMTLMQEAVRQAASELARPDSGLLQQLRKCGNRQAGRRQPYLAQGARQLRGCRSLRAACLAPARQDAPDASQPDGRGCTHAKEVRGSIA